MSDQLQLDNYLCASYDYVYDGVHRAGETKVCASCKSVIMPMVSAVKEVTVQQIGNVCYLNYINIIENPGDWPAICYVFDTKEGNSNFYRGSFSINRRRMMGMNPYMGYSLGTLNAGGSVVIRYTAVAMYSGEATETITSSVQMLYRPMIGSFSQDIVWNQSISKPCVSTINWT
jgi:hypothetical protein